MEAERQRLVKLTPDQNRLRMLQNSLNSVSEHDPRHDRLKEKINSTKDLIRTQTNIERSNSLLPKKGWKKL